jgi:hypothetical protein
MEHELRRYVECGVLAHGLTANDDPTCSSTRLYRDSFVDFGRFRFAQLQQRVLPAYTFELMNFLDIKIIE